MRGTHTKTELNELQKARLHQIIQQNFNERQFRRLCLDLGVSIHQLNGDTPKEHIQSLIHHHTRQKTLYKLLDYIQDTHPTIDVWHNVIRMPMMSTVPRAKSNRRLVLLMFLLLGVIGIVGSFFYLRLETAVVPPTLAVANIIDPTTTLAAVIQPTTVSSPTSTPTTTATVQPSTSATAPATETTTTTPFPTATTTAVVSPTVQPQLTTQETVNVRQGPGTNYPIVTVVDENSTLPVVAQHEASNGQWYIVALADGQQGWVSSRVTELIDPETLTQLPPVSTIPAVPFAVPATAVIDNNSNDAGGTIDGSLRATPVSGGS
ncbi:MAG: SH3 domain-containing protein [Chloroflexota bacterium]